MRFALALLALIVSQLTFAKSSYRAHFELTLNPASSNAQGVVRITPGKNKGMVTQMLLNVPSSRYSQLKADGELSIKGDRATWIPPAAGGTLRYVVSINHKRSNGANDALINQRWAMFRGDKVFPKARIKARGSSTSELVIKGPRGWHVNVGYPRLNQTEFRFDLTDPQRRFDQPKGWMIAGEIANRAEMISGGKFVVAGPEGQGMRRQDMLAFLNFTLPELKLAFGSMPKHFLIVGAPDPMWRGGLSGPNSLYLHLDRPLISENGTSSLLHELTHSITRISGVDGADWIVEGIAEYYGIEAIRRAGGISDERYQDTLSELKRWSKNVKNLSTSRSSGEVTARAVLLMVELDREIRAATAQKKNLDHVVRQLMQEGKKVSLDSFKAAAQKVIGKPSQSLKSPVI